MNQTIPLAWPKPPLTGNRTRGNPFARALEVATAKTEAIVAIRRAKPSPTDRADVILHFRPATKHRRDADGMFPTLKVFLDALVSEGVLQDDGWKHVPAATCRIHTPAAPAEMWVELQEVTP